MATDSRSLQRQRSYFLGRDLSSFMNGNNNIPGSMTMSEGQDDSQWSKYLSSSSSDNGPHIPLTKEEEDLFSLLTLVSESDSGKTTLRVAGGWVRDKLLSTLEFQRPSMNGESGMRLTSKWAAPSKGRKGTSIIGSATTATSTTTSTTATTTAGSGSYEYNNSNNNNLLVANHVQPLDIDIALDDMLGREFADRLNDWLLEHGRERVSVGMVLKNPEKSKHLETATMKVGKFWIDLVNLRAEEYAGDSRIPDLMRIGTAQEDSFRRDLTINALFYNINEGKVEDLTGRGLEDLKKGIVATPLHPLTTLLDDPLRALRSVRFAARLRFTMDDKLREAAKNEMVREALAKKVSRERVGGEIDLMFCSPDPVGAMRLLINLNLAQTVFPFDESLRPHQKQIFQSGLHLLSTTHDYICDCKHSPPGWCQVDRALSSVVYNDVSEVMLKDDEEARRILWYSAFLKPLRDRYMAIAKLSGTNTPQPRTRGKKAHRSLIMKLMVDELKRPARDAEGVDRIMKAADEFTKLINNNDLSSFDPKTILQHGIFVRPNNHDSSNKDKKYNSILCSMLRLDGELLAEIIIDPETTDDPIWKQAMQYRLTCANLLQQVQSFWRPALILSLSEQLSQLDFDIAIEEDVIEQTHEEVRMGIIAQYDIFAASLLQLGLIGIWTQTSLVNGVEIKMDHILPNLPMGPLFRDIMDEQIRWMTLHPGAGKEPLIDHLRDLYPDYT